MAATEPGTVLLETCRFDEENFRSYLFCDPRETLRAFKLSEVSGFFIAIAEALKAGYHIAGFFSYELGIVFEPKLVSMRAALPPLLAWVGVYDAPLTFDHRNGGPSPPGLEAGECTLTNLQLGITEDDYTDAINSVRERIAAGETYQVNFTDRLSFDLHGSPLALYERLLRKQKVSYAAYLNLGPETILSLSPELFFRIDGHRITTRPMKGTAARGRYPAEDLGAREAFGRSEKDRAENVMIVDLIRNDLGRLCQLGSIQPERLFEVESYETLFQMVSTISGTLRPEVDLQQVFHALFPSGSVTGAPKICTMQIISELERTARGVYTGAIGFASPYGNAVFNVPIRTIQLQQVEDSKSRGIMGVGGGITYASDAALEYAECLLKARFLTESAPRFQLIESIRWQDGYGLLELHLKRLQASAAYFGYPLDVAEVRSILAEHEKALREGSVSKVRLLLDEAGELSIESAPASSSIFPSVAIAPERVHSSDRFLFHKTTNRDRYNRLLAEARANGLEDYIFVNERGEVTEGAIHNVFIESNGCLYTPPLDCGLLPGVFREHLLGTNPLALERILTVQNLFSADRVFLCNAIQGLQPVEIRESGATQNARA